MRFIFTLLLWGAIFSAGYYVGRNQPRSGEQIRQAFLQMAEKAGGDPKKLGDILENLQKDPEGYLRTLGIDPKERLKKTEDAAEGKF